MSRQSSTHKLQTSPSQLDTKTLPVSTIVAADAIISRVSVFSDDKWDCSEKAPHPKERKGYTIASLTAFFGKFYATLPVPALSVREFLYAFLRRPIPSHVRANPQTARHYCRYLRVFLEWMEQYGVYRIEELTQDDIKHYVTWLANQKNGDGKTRYSIDRIQNYIAAIQRYRSYRERVSDPLLVNPLNGKSVYDYLKVKPRNTEENKTPVIPSDIWHAELRTALNFVNYYSRDILPVKAAVERVRAAEAAALEFDYHKTNPQRMKPRRHHMEPVINEFVREQSMSEIVPGDGIPWRKQPWNSISELAADMDVLYGACLFVVFSISGMRENEVALILRDSYHKVRSPDDLCWHYEVHSELTKRRRGRAVWTVIEPAYVALEVIKTLTNDTVNPHDSPFVFLTGWRQSYYKPYQPEFVQPVRAKGLLFALRLFTERDANLYSEPYLEPKVDGKRWSFDTRQFRRSFAERIAREPFGIIAGMIQYKHAQAAIFEGYAGSDPTWQKVMDEAMSEASDDFLIALWHDLEDGAVAGPRGIQLARDFKGMVETKEDALRYFLESNRAALHVGPMNYCLFDPNVALCLKESEKRAKEELMPLMNACDPNRCANSCITKQHAPAWKSVVDDANAMLKHKKVSPPQRIALTQDLEKAMQVLNQIEAAK